AEVQADLSTISLLNVAPVEVSAFDYWSLLQTLLTRVREFCHHHSVFRFRGLGQTVGSRILVLPKTATALFDQDTRGCWQDVRYPNSYASRGTREAKLYLVETPTNPIFGYGGPESVTLPVIGEVAAQYIKFNSTGYDGPPPVHTEAVTVYALPGPDVHWLLLKSPENSRVCVIRAQRMLTSPEVFEIVSSVRHDLIMHITGLTADQQFSSTTLQSALRELMSQVSASEWPGAPHIRGFRMCGIKSRSSYLHSHSFQKQERVWHPNIYRLPVGIAPARSYVAMMTPVGVASHFVSFIATWWLVLPKILLPFPRTIGTVSNRRRSIRLASSSCG